MSKYKLPVDYTKLKPKEKREVRMQYIEEQQRDCYWCGGGLDYEPPNRIKKMPINLKFFPPGFLKNPIHLQHNHDTGMTEGAVHAYCNAVMWLYHGK